MKNKRGKERDANKKITSTAEHWYGTTGTGTGIIRGLFKPTHSQPLQKNNDTL